MKSPELTVVAGFVIMTLLTILVGFFVYLQIDLGFADADNPAVMLDLLRENVHVYRSSGIVFVGMAVALVAAITALWDVYSPKPSLSVRMGFVFCVFCALFFLAFGMLRIQSTGTLLHIEPINAEWAQAGYMVVQLAGTQGFVSGAIVSFAVFMICISLDNLKRRRFATWLSWAGLGAPGFMLFMMLFGPFFSGLDNFYPVYIVSILLMFVWPSLFGFSLMRSAAGREKR